MSDIYNQDEIDQVVGKELTIAGNTYKVLSRAMCEYAPSCMSTYYNVEAPDGTEGYLSAHTVHHVLIDGEVIEKKVRKQREKDTARRDEMTAFIKELQDKELGSGAIIKQLREKYDLSKNTATSYFYALRTN